MATYTNIDIVRIFDSPANLATMMIHGQFAYDTTNDRLAVKRLADGTIVYLGSGTYLTADGSTALTGNWDVGDYNITNVNVLDADSVTISDNLNMVNTINEFSTDGTMGGNSDSAVPTEKAVKTYVDAQVLTENMWDRDSGNGYIYPVTLTDSIGIGTNSPSKKLEITTSGSADGIKISDAGGGGQFQHDPVSSTVSIQATGDTGTIDLFHSWGSGNTKGIRIGQNASSIDFAVTGEKRVGIGTTSPDKKLHVIASGSGTTGHTNDVAIFEKSAGVEAAGISIVGSTAGNSVINLGDTADIDVGRINYDHGNNSMAFVVNTSDAMRIDSSGNVGINDTTPSYRLDVNGSARVVNELIVDDKVQIGGNLTVDGGLTVSGAAASSIVGTLSLDTPTVAEAITLEKEIRITGDVDFGDGHTALANARSSQDSVLGKSFVEVNPSTGTRYYSFSDVSEGQVLFVSNKESCFPAYIDDDPVSQVSGAYMQAGSETGGVFVYINGKLRKCS